MNLNFMIVAFIGVLEIYGVPIDIQQNPLEIYQKSNSNQAEGAQLNLTNILGNVTTGTAGQNVNIPINTGASNDNNNNNSSNLKELGEVLIKINQLIQAQIDNKDKPDAARDAQLLEQSKIALAKVKELRGKGNNSKDDDKLLEQLEIILQDKINRQGKLDLTKDQQIAQTIKEKLTIIQGNNNGNNGGNNNNNNSSNLKELGEVLIKINQLIQAQIDNKDKPDAARDAQLLEQAKIALAKVKELRGKGNNSKDDDKLLEQLEIILQDKINRQGKLDLTKDQQIAQTIKEKLTIIQGNNNGNNGGNNNNNNSSNLKELGEVLIKINQLIQAQIDNKDKPDAARDAQLLEQAKIALAKVKELRGKGNNSKDDDKLLEQLEIILQDKINRQGKLDLTKDQQIVQNINEKIKIIQGNNNGNNGGNNNNNNSSNLKELGEVLIKINQLIQAQIDNKDKPDAARDAQLLEQAKIALAKVKELRGKGNNSKDDDKLLEQLEIILQDKINRQGKLDLTKDQQIVQNINEKIKIIQGNNNGNNGGNNNNNNNSSNLKELGEVLIKINQLIQAQIDNKDKPDAARDAQLLEQAKIALAKVKELRGKGNNSKDDDKLLEQLEIILQDKINRQGKLDLTKDQQIAQNINEKIKIIQGNNNGNNGGNNNNSSNLKELGEVLIKINQLIQAQINNKDKPVAARDAQLLQQAKIALAKVKELRGKGNNSKDDDKLLEQLEIILQDKINRQGKLDLTKDQQIAQTIKEKLTIIQGNNNGNNGGNNNNNNSSNLKELGEVLIKINQLIQAQIDNKDKPDAARDAQLLEQAKIALAKVKELRGKGNNSKDDDKLLEQLEIILQDKINRQGKLDLTKDQQIAQNINEKIKIIQGNNNGNNGGNNNNSSNLKELGEVLIKINQLIQAQINNKDKPDAARDAQLLQQAKIALAKVKELRGKGNNSKDDDKLLEQLEIILQDKINRQGKLDLTKDQQIVQNINEKIKIIQGNNNGNNGGNNNNNNSSNLKELGEVLFKINQLIQAQINNKDKPDAARDAQLLEQAKIALAKVKELRGKGNNSKDDDKLLEQLEIILQDKIKRQGKLDLTKDQQIVQTIKEKITLIQGNNNGNNVGNNNNNNNSSNLKELGEVLTKINILFQQIVQTIKQKITLNRGNNIGNNGGNNNNNNFSNLKELGEVLTKINILFQQIVQTIKEKITLNQGNNNGNNGGNNNNKNNNNNNNNKNNNNNNSSNLKELGEVLNKIKILIQAQIDNKDKPDAAKDAQLLEQSKIALAKVKELRGKGNNSKDDDKLLEQLEIILQDKINRRGKLDLIKDQQLEQYIKAKITIIQGSNKGDNTSVKRNNDSSSEENNSNEEKINDGSSEEDNRSGKKNNDKSSEVSNTNGKRKE